MIRPFYTEHPDVLTLDAEVLAARPGAVLTALSPFFPGGGGQLADRGTLTYGERTFPVTAVERTQAGTWHLFENMVSLPRGEVRLAVEPAFRALMSELHTAAHLLNALVYQRFEGALLTGAQIGADGTFRLDCDLPGIASEAVRALEEPLNEVIRADLPVNTFYLDRAAAEAEPGLFRSKAVAPPALADGTVRIVEIEGFDRQACGGTHLSSTGQSSIGKARPLAIVKVENKGRQNRRIRVAIAELVERI